MWEAIDKCFMTNVRLSESSMVKIMPRLFSAADSLYSVLKDEPMGPEMIIDTFISVLMLRNVEAGKGDVQSTSRNQKG